MKAGLKIILPALIFFISTSAIFAKSGCCSWHGGVAGCDTSTGRQVCNDGTYSPSCTCTYIPPATKTPVIYTPTPKPTVIPSTPVPTETPSPSLSPTPEVKAASTQILVSPSPTGKPLVSDARSSGGNIGMDILVVGAIFIIWKYRKVIKGKLKQ